MHIYIYKEFEVCIVYDAPSTCHTPVDVSKEAHSKSETKKSIRNVYIICFQNLRVLNFDLIGVQYVQVQVYPFTAYTQYMFDERNEGCVTRSTECIYQSCTEFRLQYRLYVLYSY